MIAESQNELEIKHSKLFEQFYVSTTDPSEILHVTSLPRDTAQVKWGYEMPQGGKKSQKIPVKARN